MTEQICGKKDKNDMGMDMECVMPHGHTGSCYGREVEAQEPESWEIKAFSADDVSAMIKESRSLFHEECDQWGLRTCTVCGVENVKVEQHWNDVGGPGTVQCEMCWVDGLIWFWMNESAEEVTGTDFTHEHKEGCGCNVQK